MKNLSIDTTSRMASVACIDDGKVLYEYHFHSEDAAGELTKAVSTVISGTCMKTENFDYVVVANGPGLWTGTRLGLSFAKGLVAGDSSRIYAVSVQDSLFYSVKDAVSSALCIINAYKGSFYVSEFKGRFNYKRGFPICKISIDELMDMLSSEERLVVGPGIYDLQNMYQRTSVLKKFLPSLIFPSAGSNGLMAFEKIRRNIPSSPPTPRYER